MPAGSMPPAEVAIDADLVGRLLRDQFPDLADRNITRAAEGWDNVVFRLGDDLSVRLPRRSSAAALVEDEQRWLPMLAPHLPLATPAPIAVGQPAHGYPWTWSVCPWLPGRIAATAESALVERQERANAQAIGAFLAALHQPAPAGAPSNAARGIPLAARDPVLRDALAKVADDDEVDVPAIEAAWASLVATPPWPGPPVWLHGDLHPANVLVDDVGAITAVIDFGDLSAGDPASDLAIAWMWFGPAGRAELRAAYRPDDGDTWARGRAWAIALGVAFVAASADHPIINDIGRRSLAQSLAGP